MQSGKFNCQLLFVFMHEPTFRQALSRSWQLVAHKKSLWIFGLLSALIGQMGLSDFVGMMYKTSSQNFKPYNFSLLLEFINTFNWHRVSVILLTLWLLGILLVLFIAVIFVATSARGAIIAYAIHWYKKDSILPLEEAWKKGVKKVLPLLSVTVIGRGIQLVVIYLFALISLKLVQIGSLSTSLLFILVAGFSLFIALMVEAVSIYTSGYLMLENKSLKKSFTNGWELFLNHLVVSLELGIVLVLTSAIFLGIVVYGSFVAFMPSLLMWIVAGATGLKFLIGFGVYTGVAIYVAMVLVVAGIYNAFVTSSWMYLFMKMHHEGVASRVIHFFKNLFRRS